MSKVTTHNHNGNVYVLTIYDNGTYMIVTNDNERIHIGLDAEKFDINNHLK